MLRNIRKEQWLLLTVIITFWIQIAISWKLWFDWDRSFPEIGAFSFDLQLSPWLDILLIVLGCLASVLVFKPDYRKQGIIVLLCIFAVLIIEDITRLQPWVYIFLLMMTFIGFSREKQHLKLMLLTVSAIYIWSGLHKLNFSYAYYLFPQWGEAYGIQSLFEVKPTEVEALQNGTLPARFYLAFIPAILELLLGIFLLIRKTRVIGILMAAFMHLIILYTLGPLGLNWNIIVWPWNIGFIVLLGILFWHRKSITFERKDRSLSAVLIVVYLFLLPGLQWIGWWAQPFSFMMYSGHHPEAYIYLNETKDTHLGQSANESLYMIDKDLSILQINSWALYELKVPFVGVDSYYEKLWTITCSKLPKDALPSCQILTYAPFTSKQKVKTLRCNE